MEGEEFNWSSGPRKALQSANDLLQRVVLQGGFSEDDWRAWKKILAQLDPITTLRTQLIIERTRGLDALSLPVAELYPNFGRQLGYPEFLFNVAWSIRRLFGQDQAEVILYLDEMAFAIAHSDKPFPQVHNLAHPGRWSEASLASGTLLAQQLLPAFDWLFNQSNEIVAYQRVLMCVCDVEMFRARQGKLPKTLAEISSSTARTDPFSGGELHFVVTGDEYTIYSVAEDLRDDGGARISPRHGGDIAFNPQLHKERR
jgi:hypothetical protein